MKRLDFHIHCDAGDPKQIKELLHLCEINETIVCLSGGLRYGGHDYLPNEEVLKICGQAPEWMIPLAKFDLWDQVDPDQVRRYADAGFRGLKFIYPYYEYDHDLYMPVYEAATECGLPLLFHTGNFRPSPADAVWKRPVLKNMDPLNLDRIARSFPMLHLVMAHLGTSIWRTQAAEYVKMHPNLYADLAGSGSWESLTAEKLVEMFRCPIRLMNPDLSGFGKLIFGSDAYVQHPEIMPDAKQHYEALLRKIGVPQNTFDSVMGGTAAGWLGIKL